MYETYLQNEREFDNKFDIGGFNNILERASPAEFKSFNRLSRIKEMKALEKWLEEQQERVHVTNTKGEYQGILKGLQLSIDKIREFISKLEENETKK